MEATHGEFQESKPARFSLRKMLYLIFGGWHVPFSECVCVCVVFIVEPLLNCGLDIQAVNRVHRIGQSYKTYVHRYIVQDTVEVSIDKLRMERQITHYENDIHEQKKHPIQAGGIDGGFSRGELEDLLHQS